jgi:hypothetical protein
MEARQSLSATRAVATPARPLGLLLLLGLLVCSMGASVRTPNFVIQTRDPAMARKFAETAERCRRELAVAWLGREMPNWSAPCIMSVRVGPNLGAGGQTTFVFDRGEVFGWRMSIQGSYQRILDSVLPHEVMHMILASHFRCPLPRWADEGVATSTEYPGERAKQYRTLEHCLSNGRGIAFNRMFAMTEYPRDFAPLYAQGHSLVDYLIQQGGRRKFLAYLGEGMKTQRWGDTANRYYGIKSLGDMQNRWLAWVRNGHPDLKPRTTTPEAKSEIMLATATGPVRRAVAPARSVRPARAAQGRRAPEPNLIHRTPCGAAHDPGRLALAESPYVRRPGRKPFTPGSTATYTGSVRLQSGASSVCATREMTPIVRDRPQDNGSDGAWQPPPPPATTSTARPQPVQPARQIILEWNKPGVAFDSPPTQNQSWLR